MRSSSTTEGEMLSSQSLYLFVFRHWRKPIVNFKDIKAWSLKAFEWNIFQV